jgi:cephalosporin-C deacetylase
MKKKNLILIVLTLLCSVYAPAQENLGTYQVRVSLDKPTWTYELNEPAKFTVSVTLNNSPASGLPLKYACGPEMMPPVIEKTLTTTAQPIIVDGGTLKEPGFLRCIVTVEKDGRTYRGLATAGFRPDLIKPTTTDPEDFDKFWIDGKAELAKLPLDAKLEPLPGYSTPGVDVYHVSFQNVGSGISRSSRIYGILAIPKTTDPNRKFPALLSVPGAGVRPYRGLLNLAEKGIITLQIGIHGISVILDQSVYDNLAAGPLNRYMFYNIDNKDAYYYKRVFLGAIRANDFLVGHPQFDGKNLGVIGGSQGGALAISTAALDSRVKFLAASYPALSDLTGYVHGRAGGWHHHFRSKENQTPEKIATSKYYDTVNFARRLKIPGIYSWGFNDEVCPPTSMYSAYNLITAPKTLLLGLEMGHGNSVEQTDKLNLWIEQKLKGN